MALAALEHTHALGLVTEQEYQDQLYDIARQGLEKRLALLEAAGQGETAIAVVQTALAVARAAGAASKIAAFAVGGRTDQANLVPLAPWAITDWQRSFEVNLDPRRAKKAIDVTTQIMSGGGVR